MRVAILILFLVASGSHLKAQDLDIDVTVTVTQQAIGDADPSVFKKLEADISEMINNNKWTEETFQEHEKIQGSITLAITEQLSLTSFQAELTIVSARPVFNSTYTTRLLNYADRGLVFSYDGVQPIYKSDNNYIDNLSTVLTYYMYILIGVDYDSFSPSGGDPYFEKAYEIYDALPSSLQRGDRGWTNEDISQQNRYFLLENIRNPSLKGFRTAFYEYHRKGLDLLHEDPDKARAVMVSAITQISDAEKKYPRAILVRNFTDAKDNEILDIFGPASVGEKSKVRKIMTELNPIKEAYKKLK